MKHPLVFIPYEKRAAFFWPLFAATILIMAVLNFVGGPLINESTPYGIVSFELAGTVERSAAILASWDRNAQMLAAFSLGLDFLFLLLYSTTIALACIWASDVMQALGWRLESMGVPLAWGSWMAAVLDAIENLALVKILFGALDSPYPEIAKWCAIIKFALVFAGIVYGTLGFLMAVLRRISN